MVRFFVQESFCGRVLFLHSCIIAQSNCMSPRSYFFILEDTFDPFKLNFATKTLSWGMVYVDIKGSTNIYIDFNFTKVFHWWIFYEGNVRFLETDGGLYFHPGKRLLIASICDIFKYVIFKYKMFLE